MAGLRRALCLTSSLAGLLGGFPTALLAQGPAAAAVGTPGYRLAARWKPSGEGGRGRLTLDSQAHRLYVAHAHGVQIIDTESGALVRDIPGLDDGREVALAPELNRGFATSGGGGAVLVFDLTSLRPVGAAVAVGRQPDAIVYEPLTRNVFVFNGGSGDASVIDAATAAVVATLPLGGEPGSAVVDGRGTVFVNLKEKNEVLAIDARTLTVKRRWPLASGAGPAGLAIDPISRRLFAGCSNGRLIVLYAQSGQRLADLPIGQGDAVCAVDPGAGFAYVACGDGTLTVMQGDPAAARVFRVVETVHTPPGARALAVDPKTHAVYLTATSAEGEPAAAAGAPLPPSRPETGPESFVVLKFTR